MTARQIEHYIDDDGRVVWRVLEDRGDELVQLLETEDEAEARRLFDDLVARTRAA